MAANTGEVFEHIIQTYVNPLTRTKIRLVPPAECMNQEEYDDLMGKFATFCAEAWKDKRDPETIDPRQFRAWVDDVSDSAELSDHDKLPTMSRGTCSVLDCNSSSVRREYCNKHYRRLLRWGDFNLHYRTYNLNEEFFDSVDSEVKAYWLGFITADGCVLDRDGHHRLILEIAEKDLEHLLDFKSTIFSNRDLRYRKSKETVILTLDSKHMIDSLSSLGISERKSASVEAWQGPDHLMRHYWRGLFDGDGCIHKGERSWSLDVSGSKTVLMDLLHGHVR